MAYTFEKQRNGKWKLVRIGGIIEDELDPVEREVKKLEDKYGTKDAAKE